MCLKHHAAISRAYEGLRSESFDLLCAHVTRLTPISKPQDESVLLPAVAAVLLGTFAFDGVRWLARRDIVRRRRERVWRNRVQKS